MISLQLIINLEEVVILLHNLYTASSEFRQTPIIFLESLQPFGLTQAGRVI
jgi:hypothetical protein